MSPMTRSMLPSRPAPGRSNSPRLCKHSELSDTSQQSDTTPLQAHISMVKRHPLSQAVGSPHIYHNSWCLLMSATNVADPARSAGTAPSPLERLRSCCTVHQQRSVICTPLPERSAGGCAAPCRAPWELLSSTSTTCSQSHVQRGLVSVMCKSYLGVQQGAAPSHVKCLGVVEHVGEVIWQNGAVARARQQIACMHTTVTGISSHLLISVAPLDFFPWIPFRTRIK